MGGKRNSNGSGSIFFDASRDCWRAQIQWTDKGGNKHIKKFTAKKKNEVKNKLDEFRRQLLFASGNFSNSSISFEEFARNWMETSQKNKMKPTSYLRKEVTLENQVYPCIGTIPIDQITHSDIQEMVNQINKNGLSYSTVKKAYEAVNGCLREYRIKTSSSFNPCEGITLPSNNQRPISDIIFFDDKQRVLIKNEATRLYSNEKPVYRLGHSIVVLMYTGLRIGELLALTWDDVDFKNRTINVDKNSVVSKVFSDGEHHYKIINQKSTKTKSGRRIIPMSEIACNSLKEIHKINGDKKYVMSSSTGQQISPRNINRMFHSILIKTGIAKTTDEFCGVHTLRHTFASMLFGNGCDVKVVSELLGHSDTKITENIYIHLLQQQKVKAIKDIDKYSDA